MAENFLGEDTFALEVKFDKRCLIWTHKNDPHISDYVRKNLIFKVVWGGIERMSLAKKSKNIFKQTAWRHNSKPVILTIKIISKTMYIGYFQY